MYIFRAEIKENVAARSSPLNITAFLASHDPAAEHYAQATSNACQQTGIQFTLIRTTKDSLENHLVSANHDPTIHGIMIYYPVFGDAQDQYLRNCISPEKDVEALSHLYVYNLYHNIRFLNVSGQKSLIPCTPLAIVKCLEYLNVYNLRLNYGNRLHGKCIVVVNRSEVVGRPLAAMLANDGARVFSVDIHNVQEFNRGHGLKLQRHVVLDTEFTLNNVLPLADVVITGVPGVEFKIPVDKLKEGVIAVNFSQEKNFPDAIKEKASLYVPSIGKVTIAMLQRNLLRLHGYAHLSTVPGVSA